MSNKIKWFTVNVAYRIPLEKLIGEDNFAKDFDSDPAKLERHISTEDIDEFWVKQGGYTYTIQDVMIKELPEDIDDEVGHGE